MRSAQSRRRMQGRGFGCSETSNGSLATTFGPVFIQYRSASGKRDSSAQRQTAQNHIQARNGLRGDRDAAARARQLRASWPSPGNLAVRKSAWWAREDSNLQPDRYERRARPGNPITGMVTRSGLRLCAVPGRARARHIPTDNIRNFAIERMVLPAVRTKCRDDMPIFISGWNNDVEYHLSLENHDDTQNSRSSRRFMKWSPGCIMRQEPVTTSMLCAEHQANKAANPVTQ
jgi:hypothetical protein